MKQFTGKGVYGAVAMGKISLFKKQDTVIQRTSVTDTEAEKARVEAAKAAASEQLQAIYEKALKEVGETNAQIFEIHMMMLEDDDYNESIQNIIDTQKQIFGVTRERIRQIENKAIRKLRHPSRAKKIKDFYC